MHETPYGKAVSFQGGDGLIPAGCLTMTHKVGWLTRVECRRYIRSCGFLMSQPSLICTQLDVAANLMTYSELR